MDRSILFQHGIIGSECHVRTRHCWIGVSHSDTVFLDRSVTFWHGILGSKYYIPSRYNWIGESCSDTIILNEKHIKLTKCTQYQRTQIPKWFGWGHESSWTIFILLTYFKLTLVLLTLVHVFCCLSLVKFYNWVRTIFHCILFSVFG